MSDIAAITYEDSAAVTQSDTVNDPAGPFAGFYVGSTASGATVKFTTLRGNTVTWLNVQQGTIYTIGIKRIWSSVTTASSIFGVLSNPYASAGQ